MSTRSQLLHDRIVAFAASVDHIVERIPRNVGGQHVARQLAKSSTSPIGNYGEACDAESPADYIHKMKVSLKEFRETLGWLNYVQKQWHHRLDATACQRECNELIAIFVTCVKKAGGKE